MPTFKITLAYDGTDFVGWQRQVSGRSIQGLLEDALGELDQRQVTVIGAGRTDAGVHALGQVASFTIDRAIDAGALMGALNARLPDAVRVLTATRVSEAFHARFGATKKTYRYRIWNADVLSPFERAYVWHVRGPLRVDLMQAAARLLEGQRDFAAFQATGSSTQTTERVVLSSSVHADAVESGRLRLCRTEGRLLTYEITGNGFLRHMVRNITGSLVEIGRGRRNVEWIRDVLASRDRTRAGPTAPASGLFLIRVDYNTSDVP